VSVEGCAAVFADDVVDFVAFRVPKGLTEFQYFFIFAKLQECSVFGLKILYDYLACAVCVACVREFLVVW